MFLAHLTTAAPEKPHLYPIPKVNYFLALLRQVCRAFLVHNFATAVAAGHPGLCVQLEVDHQLELIKLNLKDLNTDIQSNGQD